MHFPWKMKRFSCNIAHKWVAEHQVSHKCDQYFKLPPVLCRQTHAFDAFVDLFYANLLRRSSCLDKPELNMHKQISIIASIWHLRNVAFEPNLGHWSWAHFILFLLEAIRHNFEKCLIYFTLKWNEMIESTLLKSTASPKPHRLKHGVPLRCQLWEQQQPFRIFIRFKSQLLISNK